MPIGLGTAALIGGGLAAAGTVAAGAMSSHAQSSAAQKASDTALQTSNENNQLIRDTRDQNVGIAAPFYNNGVAAGNALNELLLGPSGTTATSAPATGALSTGSPSGYGSGALDSYLGANPDVAQEAQRVTADGEFPNADAYAAWHYQHYGQNEGRAAPAVNVPPPTAATGAAPGGALSAWDQFRNGTNYQWRFNQGLNAQNSTFAAKGALDSGAATKAAITFGQNTASNELANYMNLLAGQQNVGLSAGNAVMGVTTGATNAITAQNTSAGTTAANAALVSGQANANMWGSIGSTAGQLGGALFQYGMGKANTPQVPTASSINFTPNWQANTPVPSAYGGGGF